MKPLIRIIVCSWILLCTLSLLPSLYPLNFDLGNRVLAPCSLVLLAITVALPFVTFGLSEHNKNKAAAKYWHDLWDAEKKNETLLRASQSPAPTFLLRGSEEPPPDPDQLLRAATDQQTPPEQLLRANPTE